MVSDKLGAIQKGMWMGGPVPLGYDAIDRKLVIDETGAKTVYRRIADLISGPGERQVMTHLRRSRVDGETTAKRTKRPLKLGSWRSALRRKAEIRSNLCYVSIALQGDTS